MHILFHICGKLIEHHSTFLNFFKDGTVSCGGLQASIRQDFEHPIAVIEMQVLGLLGKLLTGPWMQVFYTSAESELDHIKWISVIKNVMTTLKVAVKDPCHIITRDTDFFGRLLSKNDDTLRKLQAEPSNKKQFTKWL